MESEISKRAFGPITPFSCSARGACQSSETRLGGLALVRARSISLCGYDARASRTVSFLELGTSGKFVPWAGWIRNRTFPGHRVRILASSREDVTSLQSVANVSRRRTGGIHAFRFPVGFRSAKVNPWQLP